MEYSAYKKLQEEGSGLSFGTRWGDQMEAAILDYLGDINQIGKDSKIIDVGCGEGRGLLALKKLGYEDLTGVDISTPKIELARNSGLRVFEMDFHDLSGFKDKEFDYLFCSHAIEHSLDPIKVLKEMFRIASNGLIIVPIDEKEQPPLGESPHTHNFATKEDWFKVWDLAFTGDRDEHFIEKRLGTECWSYFYDT